MVKNANGGGNAKKQARKHQNTFEKRELIRVTERGEHYAEVIEMRGGNLCKVKLMDGDEMIAHIGGKFRGRNKRSNFIEKGTWMLVGEREWEKECKNVEVMYVYEKDEREELKREFGSIVYEGENEGIEFVDRSSKSKEEVVEILRERGMCEEEEILMEDI